MSDPRLLVAYSFAEALPGLVALAVLLGAGAERLAAEIKRGRP